MNSIATQLNDRIAQAKPGTVFVTADFLDVGSRAAVDQTLSRLAKSGAIRRAARGVYDVPRVHPVVGLLTPDLDNIAQAIARKSGYRAMVSGARAANLLGLTTQVPAKAVYLTDGPTRNVHVANQIVSFRRTSPRFLPDGKGGLVVQALRHLGKTGVDNSVISHLRQAISPDDADSLRQTAKKAPAWVSRVIDQVVAA